MCTWQKFGTSSHHLNQSTWVNILELWSKRRPHPKPPPPCPPPRGVSQSRLWDCLDEMYPHDWPGVNLPVNQKTTAYCGRYETFPYCGGLWWWHSLTHDLGFALTFTYATSSSPCHHRVWCLLVAANCVTFACSRLILATWLSCCPRFYGY